MDSGEIPIEPMFKNLAYGNSYSVYSVKNLDTALVRTAAAAVIMMSVPGPKMIWQFGELGYDYELNNDRLAPKPVRWDYYDDVNRRKLYDAFSKINKLKATKDLFSTTNYNIELSGKVKSIQLFTTGADALVVANFDVVPQAVNIELSRNTEWKDEFSDKTFNGNVLNETIEAGGYRLYISK